MEFRLWELPYISVDITLLVRKMNFKILQIKIHVTENVLTF